MKNNNEIVYSLNVEDIQTVSIQEFDRELTDEEIEKIIDPIAENINWYEAILDAITTKINFTDNK